MTLTKLSQKTKEMLIDASSFHSFIAELVLLTRLHDLVELFPDTRHPLVHSKRGKTKRAGNPVTDERIEHILNQDPDLRKFLTSCSFDMNERRSFVEERVSTMRFATGHPDIACKRCGDYSYLPESFLREVGSYTERFPEDGG